MKDLTELSIEGLKELIERKIKYCSGWKDSGNSGACFAYEVTPLENELKKRINNIINDGLEATNCDKEN